MSIARPDQQTGTVALTPAGIWRGAKAGVPMLGSGFVYGLAFGTLAASAGLSLLESILMSALVFSGTAQIAVLQVWQSQPSAVAAALIVLIANVRYVLLSASLRPWLGSLPTWKALVPLTFLVDGAYASGMQAKARGDEDVGVLLGPSLMSFSGWVSATGIGFVSGQALANPRLYGLDFVVVAFCVSAATVMAKGIVAKSGGRDLIPALAAGIVAIAVNRLLPGPWVIIAACVTAVVIGAARYRGDDA